MPAPKQESPIMIIASEAEMQRWDQWFDGEKPTPEQQQRCASAVLTESHVVVVYDESINNLRLIS